jgi:hypothetical protein
MKGHSNDNLKKVLIMIFKTLVENEEHSNLLEIAQHITIDQTNIFPEKFLFYVFSKYDLYSLSMEFRNKKTISIRSLVDHKLTEIAILEYMNNGDSIILTDEILFEPGEIKNISDPLIRENGFANYNNYNNVKKFLTVPFFGDLDYRVSAQAAYPYGGDASLRFIRHHKINNWSSTISILLDYIDKTKTKLTDQNLNSFKVILSDLLLIDLSDENHESFIRNSSNYNKLIGMKQI